AAQDYPTAVSLLLVCKEVRLWILPVLYTTVVLTSSNAIIRFFRGLMQDAGPNPTSPILAPLVRHLWMGPIGRSPTPGFPKAFEVNDGYWSSADLQLYSTSWPITMMHQILSSCTSLRSLAILNLGQNNWSHLEGVIPTTLESLWLGPIHGPLILKNFRHHPRLRTITSIDTYMRDDEVKDIVLSPHCRVFRRAYIRSPQAVEYAFQQLPCVAQSSTLEEMRIELHGIAGDDAWEARLKQLEEKYLPFCLDKRVKIVVRPEAQTQGIFRTIFRDWQLETLSSESMVNSYIVYFV
ncbi:hypothetical protein JAAARDRAFT_128814, partial [Jaapia argillacea MUCL 33604]